MKDQIVERLLTEGHITINMADSLLNDRLEKTSTVALLREDSIISVQEAVILLKDNHELYQPSFPPMPAMPPFPTNPYQPPFTPGDVPPGTPFWYTTGTTYNKTPFEYSDTKWPGDKKE